MVLKLISGMLFRVRFWRNYKQRVQRLVLILIFLRAQVLKKIHLIFRFSTFLAKKRKKKAIVFCHQCTLAPCLKETGKR